MKKLASGKTFSIRTRTSKKLRNVLQVCGRKADKMKASMDFMHGSWKPKRIDACVQPEDYIEGINKAGTRIPLLLKAKNFQPLVDESLKKQSKELSSSCES